MADTAHPSRAGRTPAQPPGDACEATLVVPALSPAFGRGDENGSVLALLLMEVLHALPGVHRIRVDRTSARVCVGYQCGMVSADDLRAHLNLAGFVVDSGAAA